MSVSIVQSCDYNISEVIARSSVPDEEKRLSTFIARSEEVWFGLHDGQVAAIWGVIQPTVISNRMYLWLFTTDLVDKHKFLLVRHSQLFIDRVLKRYPVIVGHVSIHNDRAKRWLRWLGAEFGPIENQHFTFKIRRLS